ncbi:MAG: ribonuclease R [Proteobacteria bacterium]|nr:ribonuclease R [Pseudomonadota bacterium]MBU1688518.1 ribonuclease R [Pseudomonadota bacterium]
MSTRNRTRRTPAGKRHRGPGRQSVEEKNGKRGQNRSPRHSRHREESAVTGPSRSDDIIGFIYAAGGEATAKDIHHALASESRSEQKKTDLILEELCREKALTCRKRVYSIRKDGNLREAIFQGNPRGFGFAIPPPVPGQPESIPHDRSGDFFIPPGAVGRAAHGDRILIRVSASRSGKTEARVISVLARQAAKVVGRLVIKDGDFRVIPEDDRLTYAVEISPDGIGGAENGMIVLAEIIEFNLTHKNPSGRVIKVFGDPARAEVQAEIVIHLHQLPDTFSNETLAEANNLSGVIEPAAGRADLRQIHHVTIDGETARDFDDAVAVISTGKGFTLYVSIADVSHYVTPGSAIDRDAYQRGTSVYFPGRVVPMLPERLSNDLCSLVPDQDRYAFTAILEFDREGKRLGKSFTRSIIRSHHRFTYTTVAQILVDQDPEIRATHQTFIDDLERMGQLGRILEKVRMARGSIGFELPEAEITLAEDGSIASVSRSQRNLAHKLIEEFMLAANEAVASTFTEKGTRQPGFLYRIHEPPDPLKVEEFAEFSRRIGIILPPEPYNPSWFNQAVDSVRGTPKEYIVNNLLLRTMQQARYSPENAGHFGLAASDYSHFTSPIRRYPDLMVHRALSTLLSGGERHRAGTPPGPDTDDAGLFLSQRERVAVDAERDIIARLQAWYMAKHLGEEFTGIISGVAPFGLFIELLESMISGAIPIGDLTGDSYELDDKNHRVLGRGTRRVLQVGDLIRVRVNEVDLQRRRINFVLVEELP